MQNIANTPHFDPAYVEHAQDLSDAIGYVIENVDNYSRTTLLTLTHWIWETYKYLSGNTRNEIPYEIEYSLKLALKDWVGDNPSITTALLTEAKDFHFLPLNVLSKVKELVPDYNFRTSDAELIHVALPKFYRNYPIFGIPMYHEIGHYVDHRFGITKITFIRLVTSGKLDNLINRYPHLLPKLISQYDQSTQFKVINRYLSEHFADLFAACYVGYGNNELLRSITEDLQGFSPSHPATASRLMVSDDFLSSLQNDIVDEFQATLRGLGLPALVQRYSDPDVINSYDNVRPYDIKSPAELHGIYYASWKYIALRSVCKTGFWKGAPEDKILRVVNDLAEKTIRNYSIKEKWNSAIA